MKTIRVTWTDSITAGILGTKVYRDDIEIADVANGVELYDDPAAVIGEIYKYEVQGYTASGESIDEVTNVNVDTIEVLDTVIPTNYVFNGGAVSYMVDKAVTSTMLDGIVNQSWMVRLKMPVSGAGTNRGIICTENGFGSSIYLTLRGDDKLDGILRDTGESTIVNAVVSTTLDVWTTYFLEYDGSYMRIYEGDQLILETLSADFTARTAGRKFAVGASTLAGTPIPLIGDVSNVRFFSRVTTPAEKTALIADPDAVVANTVANFSGQKTGSGGVAGDWTSEVGGYVLENKGTVTYN